MDKENLSFSISNSQLAQLDDIVKINEYHSRSEALRVAIKEFIDRERKRANIGHAIAAIARGELPSFVKKANFDIRDKNALDKIQKMLDEQVNF